MSGLKSALIGLKLINKPSINCIVSETSLSEAIQFSSTAEVKPWLEKQTNAILSPVQEEAKKLKDNMNWLCRKSTKSAKCFLKIAQRKLIEGT